MALFSRGSKHHARKPGVPGPAPADPAGPAEGGFIPTEGAFIDDESAVVPAEGTSAAVESASGARDGALLAAADVSPDQLVPAVRPQESADDGVERGERTLGGSEDAVGANGHALGATDAAPHVGISVSAYGGFGAAPAARTAQPEASATEQATGEAPPQTESLPGLPDNVIVQAALAALGDDPQPHEVLNVARQLLQGTLYLRVKGDAQALVAAGEEIPLAIATRDDGRFVLAYSSGAALAAAVNADGDTETSAMGQAAPLVLQYVLQNRFDGIIIDQASAPASVVLPLALVERMFTEIDPALTLKHLISQPRTPQTSAAVGEAVAAAPLWIAVNRASEDDDWGVAESRMDDGTRILPVFSHPLEVVAVGHGDQPMPFTAAQLGSVLREDTGIAGVVVDPAGPWIVLGRDDLGAVLALPEPDPAVADGATDAVVEDPTGTDGADAVAVDGDAVGAADADTADTGEAAGPDTAAS